MARSNNSNRQIRAPFSSSAGPRKAKASAGSSSTTAGPGGSNTSASAPALRPGKIRNFDSSNAYTYVPALPKRHRTSEATFSLSRDELALSGPSSRSRQAPARLGQDPEDGEEEGEEQEDMQERIRKLAMNIAADEVGPVESGSDDSEIDSDAAFDESGSDEERWGDVFRGLQKGKGKKGKGKGKEKEVVMKPAKPFTVDLDESDGEEKAGGKSTTAPLQSDLEESSDEDEGEVLSDDDGEDGEVVDGIEDDEEEDQDEEDEESDANLPSDMSDDDDEDGEADDTNGLDTFAAQLDAADREKAISQGEAAGTSKKRRVLPVTSSTGPAKNGKIDISTLLASHPSLSSASALLPSKVNPTSSSVLKQGVLPAPLPTVVQDRLDREAAYEKTKEEGQKWSGAMKRIKEAEHLSFPLQGSDRGGVKSSGEMLSSFKPQNELESAVTALLNKANLTEEGIKKMEDNALEAQDLSLEEIEERRGQLRLQRELLFRAEARAKRVAKIKSKTFRKLARKRADKAGAGKLDIDELERLDPEAADAEREKLERQRAKERATLRHGARSSKWARDVGGDANEMEDRRRAKEEMLDIKERLQRKIAGRGEDGDDTSSDDEEGGEEGYDSDQDDEEVIKTKAFDQLANLSSKDPQEPNGKKKGIMNMAFMQKAQEREMKKVAEEEETLRRDIEMFGGEGDSGDEDSDEEGGNGTMHLVGGNQGRMVFAPAKNGDEQDKQSAQSDDDSDVDVDVVVAPTTKPAAGHSSTTAKGFRSSQAVPPATAAPDHNPWLTASSTSAGPSRKRNAAQATDKATKHLLKSAAAREAALEDERVDIDPDLDGTSLVRSGKKSKGKGQDKRSREDESDGGSDEGMLPNGLKGFKQRDLVAEAFAGDNVVEDFAQEKARQIAADAPKVEDTSLPGWGNWSGKGLKKRKTNPKFLVKTAGIEPTARKDFNNTNVIITEKKDKRASQFLVKDLPYPYTSKAQYEATFNTPLGGEWNSRSVVRRETVPRIVKKPGAIIEPIRRLF